ncbi:M20 family peptidase [Sneathiella sp.]|uniref:M20 family peptidase n=1 Tax=Sneathiella sp. TaxID=1964365 RepID=UPI003561C487
MIKKIVLSVVVLLIVLIAVLAIKTFLNSAADTQVTAIELPTFDTVAAVNRLAEAVKIKTVSTGTTNPVAAEEFDRLHLLINSSYPLIAEKLTREVVNGHSLLYTWKGTDASLKPILLMGHMDVVPVEAGTEDDWTHGAFSGDIAEGAVWGRGTLDDKLSVFAILEAAELQLKAGFTPARTMYFGFGHDEEIGGDNGAGKIAALLKSRGVELTFSIDEGMVVVQGLMPGIDDPIAFIALAEKGYLTVSLTATTAGGHSSIPPRTTAIGKIARAITRLEENRFPATLQSPASDMFDSLSPHMTLPLKAIISNRWLLEPLLVGELGKGGATNAMVRTTTAVTIINGGTKDNVLPSTASATVNFRLLPGTRIDDVIEHVRTTIEDPDIEITVLQGNEPSRISSKDSDGYRAIETTIHEILPDVLISPGLMLAGSDSKHYEDISENNYRFIPMRLGPDDLARIHGTNERILIDNYIEIIQFYRRLMENAASGA